MNVLVAGVGNVFLGDDGFGVAVARHLAAAGVPEGVMVSDFGIRGVHLAYELTGGRYDLAVLVDTVAARDDPPGTLRVLLPSPDQAPGTFVDAHDMTPDAVLALAGTFGRPVVPVLLVGCAPADVSPGMELSPPVAAAVGPAADLVLDLIADLPPEISAELAAGAGGARAVAPTASRAADRTAGRQGVRTGGGAEEHTGEEMADEASVHADRHGGDRRHRVPVDPRHQAVHEDPPDVSAAPATAAEPAPARRPQGAGGGGRGVADTDLEIEKR
ncbi:hypothetical protein Sme01_51710 [Sphaerisporangium melleum]|uniref:Hydrogenase maturation protease n=1 Tax=Sphaerisporangium melleum TaxID=321316 RepID=A0A917QYT2_9ACTN|nr:hydrogenase maturation protease [Sphaerisporangium melleum]GGK75960.1 hypothetical protein GCM10007964_18470 [Sphaerisporangium melleum]GII72695.1 hypothetical protein Sme01_51710 [Sphaerisporangium melleum]